MITTKDEYKYVTFVDDIKVDGGIMPARDVEGLGKWKELRGEDLAFCTEAMFQRMSITEEQYQLNTFIRKEIYFYRWFQLTVAEWTIAGCFVKKDFVFTWLDLRFPILENEKVRSIYSGSNISPDLMTTYDDFKKGGVLEADKVRGVFHDINVMTRPCVIKTTPKYSGQGFSPIHSEGRPVPDAGFVFPTILRHNAVSWEDTTLGGSGSCRNAILYGEYLVDRASDATWVLSDVSWANGDTIALVELEGQLVEETISGVKTTTYKRAIVPFPASIVSRIPRAMVRFNTYEVYEAANAIGQALGYPTGHEIAGRKLFTHDVTVRIRSIRLVFTLNDHTDFSHLGWVWP